MVSRMSRDSIISHRRDLIDLHRAETEFEGSLDSEQAIEVQAQLESLESQWRHLESDAQSLALELRNEYPTRWHIARDAFDMQKEIQHWCKLHNQVAAMLHLTK